MTDEDHNKYLAFSFLAHGAIQVLFIGFFGLIMLLITAAPGNPEPPAIIFAFFFLMMFIFQMIFTAPAFVAAYGLLKRKPWARTASIIAGIAAVMSVPVGTAAGVYALWFCFSDHWRSVYTNAGERPDNVNRQLSPADVSEWRHSGEDRQREFSFEHREPPDWR